MMQQRIAFCIILVLVLIVCSVVADPSKDWAHFKNNHGKKYENPLEESMRYDIYLRNVQEIDRFNEEESEKVGFRLKVNHLADKTDEELKSMRGTKVPSELKNTPKAELFLKKMFNSNAKQALPESVDWTKVEGRVSEVKDQGNCGACWSFASTGALEGQMMVANKTKGLISLSEQDLIDCSKADDGNQGCGGGFMLRAFEDIHRLGGIEDEKSYPYEAKTLECRYKQNKSVFGDMGGALLPKNEDKLKEVVANFGPVSVGIDASHLKFRFYDDGVHYDKYCHSDPNYLDHAVLVVGYGTDPKQGDYWLVKNSWGKRWGLKGYIKMARGRNNNCGIVTAPVIPTFS